eukprot:9138404-Heterocapsa_arctica.AAC.1
MWDWDQLIEFFKKDARKTRRNKAALEMGLESVDGKWLDCKPADAGSKGGSKGGITFKQNKAALEMGIEACRRSWTGLTRTSWRRR